METIFKAYRMDVLPEPSITTGTSGRVAACGMLTGFDLAGRDPPVTPISMASDSTRLTLIMNNNQLFALTIVCFESSLFRMAVIVGKKIQKHFPLTKSPIFPNQSPDF